MLSVIRATYANAGVKGLWAGWVPNVIRSILVNASEIGVYDQAKTAFAGVDYVYFTPVLQHVAASGAAGLVSACTSTPVDLVKTRLMHQSGKSPGKAKGILQILKEIIDEGGFIGLWGGFTPAVIRKVAWCTVFFVTYERTLAL
jgi:solute carrier family 25 (mitochondrial uncoupling protein), member 27